MSSSPHDPIFLATTALESFWDTKRKMVFLGPGCLRYDRRESWEKLQAPVMESPLATPESCARAYDYVQVAYERTLAALSPAMNEMHGVRRTARFWRILLGPWLQSYLAALYDRFLHLRCAAETYPGFTTIALSPDCFRAPRDTLESALLASEDGYNLQLYTRILEFLGVACTRREHQMRPAVFNGGGRGGVTQSAAAGLLRWGERPHAVILKNASFARHLQLVLAVRTFGAVWPNLHPPCSMASVPIIDASKRAAVQVHLPAGSEFESLVRQTLPFDMPSCFVESFAEQLKVAKQHYPPAPRAILSANSWYYDEEFKFWAADAAERGGLLLGTQHGANYGSLLRMFSEQHESQILDRYYTWGWTAEKRHARMVPMAAAKLTGRDELSVVADATAILFAATTTPRYVLQLPYTPQQFLGSLASHQRFLASLPSGLRSNIQFRAHRVDYGWSTGQRLKDAFPEITLQDWHVSFWKSLQRCRLYVCDHCSTTFAEALAANKPTILFWDPSANEMRPEAQPYYDALLAAGILFYSPEGAARAVAEVYDNVAAWWSREEVQAARRLFCERLARTSKDALRQWAAELSAIANSADAALAAATNRC